MSALEELKQGWREATEGGPGLWLYLWPVSIAAASAQMLLTHQVHGRDREELIFCALMFFVGLANGWLLRGRR